MEGQRRVGVGVNGGTGACGCGCKGRGEWGEGGGVVDTILGSFSIHDASGSINLGIKMNSDFLSHRNRCDVYVSVVAYLRPP